MGALKELLVAALPTAVADCVYSVEPKQTTYKVTLIVGEGQGRVKNYWFPRRDCWPTDEVIARLCLEAP